MSSSIINLNALSGVMNQSPPCYVLEIDNFFILLDIGWNEKYLHKIDCVLISHSDTYHLGALPYLVGKCGLSCPVYSTIPTFKMGQLFMYDWYLNRHNTQDFDLFNLDDIDCSFDKIVQLPYNRPISLKGKGLGITITALPAGHSLGGAVWKISKAGEQDIYYAIDHNNKKERHLNGFEVEKIQRPGIFITNALNALYVQEKRRKRDEMLLGTMQQTLRTGGNVLVATDSAGRALELILMLDQMWKMRDSGLSNYSLVFLNNVAFNVIEFAKTQVEWMSEKLIKAFENQKINPFQLKNVTICHTLIELSQIASPKVVVTSSADLECGFARDLFLQWCQDPRSCVCITQRTSPGTLGRLLIDGVPKGKKMDLEIRQRVKLEGKELEEYLQRKRRKVVDVIDIEDCEEEEPEVVFNRVHNQKRNNTMKQEFISEHLQRGGGGDSPEILLISSEDSSTSVFKMNNNNNHSAFNGESAPKRRRFDDYGEIIQAEDFKENGKFSKDNKGGNNKKRSNTLSCSENSESDPPTKIVSTTQTFSINCQVLFIDFEGRSDIEALLKMLQEINPQQLVIVRGTPESTLALDTLAQKLLPNTKIFKPSLGKTISLTNSTTKLFQVKLTDAIMSSLELKKVRDCEVAWIDGQIMPCDNSTENAGPSIEPSKEKTPHPTMVLNRLRISEFRQILAKNGIECEVYRKGTLKCACSNGIVYIEKDSETQTIHIECDGLPEEYYKIRSLLYEQMAML